MMVPKSRDNRNILPAVVQTQRITRRVAIRILFASIPVSLLLMALVHSASVYKEIQASRRSVIVAVLGKIDANSSLKNALGAPVVVTPGTRGKVTEDKTGWQEARLLIPVRGKNGQAVVRIAAGRIESAWTFSTFDVLFKKSRTEVDLLTGKETDNDANIAAEVEKLPVAPPEFTVMDAPPPKVPADYPCVAGGLGTSAAPPHLSMCPIDVDPGRPVDEAEADLRYGHIVLRETDLYLDDVFQVPLTRTYTSVDWATRNNVHAFGRNTNHYWDMAPVGTRNPYTYQNLVLADGDVLFFGRVSRGTGYWNAVFRHTDTATGFYKAIARWNGHGWTIHLTDGGEIFFPESYDAKNMAQGGPTEMLDALGNRLQLIRDAKRNLQEILTPHGHWIRFIFDGESRIVRAEDDAGHWAQYGYNQQGMLSFVSTSSGNQRHFEYVGDRMVEVINKQGVPLLKNWFQGSQLVRQEFSDGEVYSYRYLVSKNRWYYTKVYVTLPNHSVQPIDLEGYIPDFVKQK